MSADPMPTPESPSADGNVITGTITDASTEQPLDNVAVTITSPALQSEQHLVTDDSGSYVVPDLPAGEYAVRFDKDSFNSLTREGIVLLAGCTMPVDEELAPSKEHTITLLSSRSVFYNRADVGTRDTITFEGGGDNPPTSALIEPHQNWHWSIIKPSLFGADVTSIVVPSTHTVARSTECWFTIRAGDYQADIIVSGGQKPPTVITLTCGGISPSETNVRASARIAFATAGEDAPTSMTVTSDSPGVPDTALFGGDSSTYAVPSTLAVQARARTSMEESVTDTFTITALGHTAQIVVEHGVGDPMDPPTNHTGG